MFNAMILVGLGFVALFFVNGDAAPLLSGARSGSRPDYWWASRRLRKGTEWG